MYTIYIYIYIFFFKFWFAEDSLQPRPWEGPRFTHVRTAFLVRPYDSEHWPFEDWIRFRPKVTGRMSFTEYGWTERRWLSLDHRSRCFSPLHLVTETGPGFVALCSIMCTGRRITSNNQVNLKKYFVITYVNSRPDEIGQFLHPVHKTAPHLAQVATVISVFLFLPNWIHDWSRLWILTRSLQYATVTGSSFSFKYSQHEFNRSNIKNSCRISVPLTFRHRASSI